jgi:hypothetical protein
MTAAPMFVEELRHRCRNPRCRAKLAEPVENKRSAFCCRGCHQQFYTKRCLACEQPMERTAPNKRLCGRRACANEFNALKAHGILSRYTSGPNPKADSKKPIKTGTFSRLKSDRGWRQVAGPPISLRLATVGADDAVKQADKTNRRHWSEAGAAAEIQRHHAPVNIVG